ncbi:MAG: signal peptidase I [Planctomycetota bacterium]
MSSPSETTTIASSADAEQAGVRTTIEQVLIALVLAFVFRAFVVEAFIIPTGSMATTLLGAHMRFDCPDCGWDYDVNYRTVGSTTFIPKKAQNSSGEDRTLNIRCPNCGFRQPPRPMPGLDPVDENAQGPNVYYGDRILVLKYLYLFQDPQRYDVVVFKNPSRSGAAYANLPVESTESYQENYIKRLVGLPGESVLLLDGDVYIAGDARHKETAELTASDFKIARKSDTVQEALWRVVYDDDFRPRGAERDVQLSGGRVETDADFELPWKPSGGWRVESDGFAFAGEGGQLTFDKDANPLCFYLLDYIAYNQTWDDGLRGKDSADTFGRGFNFAGGPHSRDPGTAWLHYADDLRLSLVHHRRDGGGPIALRLSGNGKTFVARVTPGEVVLLDETDPSSPVELARHSDAGVSAVGGTSRLQLAHFDYAIHVEIDGKRVIETNYEPDVGELIFEERNSLKGPEPAASISAVGHVADITRVKLYRDVHYTARDQTAGGSGGGGLHPYASPELFPHGVMRLGEEEYFVIGDNPMLSGDARTWTDDVLLPRERLASDAGRVPGRFLLGKAFFVYWPGGYRPLPFLPPVVPNVGDMRFIR